MLKKGVERGQVLRALGEVFRAHGYEGASLTLITEATGLGKGSLYHLFPGGKEQMAAEVLADIDGWFELNIYAPLREASDPARAIAAMIAGVDQYFHSGDRVCLVGLVALGSARDTFAEAVDDYFARWQVALASLLRRSGLSKGQAQRRAEDALLTIQGALVLARARNDAGIFRRALSDLTARAIGAGGVMAAGTTSSLRTQGPIRRGLASCSRWATTALTHERRGYGPRAKCAIAHRRDDVLRTIAYACRLVPREFGLVQFELLGGRLRDARAARAAARNRPSRLAISPVRSAASPSSS
jgi:AcrR family transcriptional regulator